MQIEVVSDVVCPWCFVGKRKLEQALAQHAQTGAPPPTVYWRPFQLNPQLPPEGMDRKEYVARKFGGRGSEVYARVAAAGQDVGIAFAFDRIVRQPNTVLPHALIAAGEAHGVQDAVKEALLRAYFLDGRDLTNAAVLTEIATEASLPATAIERCLHDPAARAEVEAEEARFRAYGVEGVPFFIFDRKLAVSGAQDPAVLLNAMRQAEQAPAAA